MMGTDTKLALVTDVFEGVNLTTLTYRGRPAWIAREVGELLEYSENGKQLVRNTSGDWAEEFIEGDDFTVVSGKELAEIKEALRLVGNSPIQSRAPSLLLLFESGLNIALMKTNKPIGTRLRRFIATKVMPQLTRDGAYIPERKVVKGEIIGKANAAAEKERRLMRKLELEERKFHEECRLNRQSVAISSINTALQNIPQLSEEARQALQVKALEVGTCETFNALKPNVEHDWLSPTDIANKLGVTAARIGRTVSELNIRGNIEGIARAIMNTNIGGSRNVTTYLYSPMAVGRITDNLAKSGHLEVV